MLSEQRLVIQLLQCTRHWTLNDGACARDGGSTSDQRTIAAVLTAELAVCVPDRPEFGLCARWGEPTRARIDGTGLPGTLTPRESKLAALGVLSGAGRSQSGPVLAELAVLNVDRMLRNAAKRAVIADIRAAQAVGTNAKQIGPDGARVGEACRASLSVDRRRPGSPQRPAGECCETRHGGS